MGKIAILLLFVIPFLLLSGCNTKRELKTAVCIVKSQPAENECLERLAIDAKGTAPCDRIKTLHLANGTIVLPTKVTCYSEVAYWKGEESICNGLSSDAEISECKYRYSLYMKTARQ
ncbi:MAG: hypothetical protein ABIG96_02535 [Candidatus Micrarchaeota archaeon]